MKRAAAPSATVTSLSHSASSLDDSGIRTIEETRAVSEAIAEGGMASVHLVAKDEDGRLYALKRLHAHLAADEYFTSMLFDEAAIAASVRHENVVTTYGIDTYEGRPCVVMEYVPGLSVSAVIQHSHPARVPVPFAIKIAAEALRGLHAAHETCDTTGRPLGIVHRDVSPQNILVGLDGVARVLDFGIAKAEHRIHSTRPGDLKGKLAYMAPEQLCGHTLDARTDLRAVAVVLWELLTSAPLFHSAREELTVEKIIGGAVRPPSEITDGIPPELDAIVLRALALNPADRFPSALAMAEALEAVGARYSFVTSELIGEWVHTLGYDEIDERLRLGADLRRSIPDPPTRVLRESIPKEPPTEPTRLGTPWLEQASTPLAAAIAPWLDAPIAPPPSAAAPLRLAGLSRSAPVPIAPLPIAPSSSPPVSIAPPSSTPRSRRTLTIPPKPRSFWSKIAEPAVFFISALIIGIGGGLYVRMRYLPSQGR